MGNHPSKERTASPRRATVPSASTASPYQTSSSSQQTSDQSSSLVDRPDSARRRSSRHDLSLFSIGNRPPEIDPASPEARRETRAEREARKLEKERASRQRERERSVREEGVDGGYLVTLGTYTGTEDFNKPVVRRLMIERRLAPFWRGLNDHKQDWKDNQLIAAAQGLPIPPPQDNTLPTGSAGAEQQSDQTPTSSQSNIASQSIAIPINPSSPLNDSPSLSPSHPAFSSTFTSSLASASTPDQPSAFKYPMFRGRAKTLASLTSLSRNHSQPEMTPQERMLPRDPYIHGQPLEAFLYREASECPICFLYYPPYLNRTRCCDQSICSECFVQIKRPDPHFPEHADPTDPTNPVLPANPPLQPHAEEDQQLVSESATCPFCKTPDLGITYEPPPYRRGLAYGNNPSQFRSAMSSSSSINSQSIPGHSRRRNASISADAPNVITTDKIRPDWAKKLADARAHAQRRAAAATALHNAAYVLGSMGESSRNPFMIGRRRRTLFGSGDAEQQNAVQQLSQVSAMLAASGVSATARPGQAPPDLLPGRVSSRRNRIEDLEEMMMMEAIRQSVLSEEDRQKKEKEESSQQAIEGTRVDGGGQTELTEVSSGAGTGTLLPSKVSGSSEGASSATTSVGMAGQTSTTAKGKAVDRNNQPDNASANVGVDASLSVPLASGSSSSRPVQPLSFTSSSASSISDDGLDSGVARSSNEPSPSIELGPNGSGVSLDGAAFNSETPPGSAGVDGSTGGPVFSFRSLDEVVGDPSPRSGNESPDFAKNTVEASVEEDGSGVEATR